MLVLVIPQRRSFDWSSHSQQLAASGQFLLAVAVAEQAVIANALESIGQSVNEKTADELLGGKRHGFLVTLMSVVFPLETHLTICDIQQAMVRHRNTVGVSSDVIEHLLRASTRSLGIYNPFGFSERRQVTAKFAAVPEFFQAGKELQFAGIERVLKIFQEKAAEQS